MNSTNQNTQFIPILITNYDGLTKSHGKSNNTGQIYEKRATISLMKAGNVNLISENDITDDALKNITPYRILNGSSCTTIIGIYNLTQLDHVGGTADIRLLLSNKKTLDLSITLYKTKKLTKCIRNPSGTLYGLCKTEELEEANLEAYKNAVELRKYARGSEPSKLWKRFRCVVTKTFCTLMAEQASNKWNALPLEVRRGQTCTLLDLDDKLNTKSNGILFYNNKKSRTEHLFKWSVKIYIDDYLNTFSRGIYIYHGKSEKDWIMRTQVKYNNGIIEGMSSKIDVEKWKIRPSKNYLSSWNCVANLQKIFKLEPLVLD